MERIKSLSQIPIYPLFIAVSLLAGWFVPGFYEWTDSDQSRPSPLLWKVPLWSAIGSIAFCAALPWLPITIKSSTHTPRSPAQFSIRMLLTTTASIAVIIALLAKFPLVISGGLCAVAFVYFAVFIVRNPQHRMAAFALIACMALPYIWLVSYDELDRILPTLTVMIAGMPAFVPSMLIGALIGQHFQESQWLAFLLTAVELLVGIWMIRLGPKRTVAYLLFVMQVSLLGSLVFYQLCVF